jgi:hypothetical protein
MHGKIDKTAIYIPVSYGLRCLYAKQQANFYFWLCGKQDNARISGFSHVMILFRLTQQLLLNSRAWRGRLSSQESLWVLSLQGG